jgi:hypothetical protein
MVRGQRSKLVKYSPECVEGTFSEVGFPIYGVLKKFAEIRAVEANAAILGP